MAWHLKDRELEKKLNEISDGDFSQALAYRSQPVDSPLDRLVKLRVFFGDAPDFLSNRFSAIFRDDELEDVPEYNPHDWNEYPKVKPPFDKDMRVELDDGLRYCARYHKFSGGCFWVGTNGTCFPKYLNDKVVRFRPWED